MMRTLHITLITSILLIFTVSSFAQTSKADIPHFIPQSQEYTAIKVYPNPTKDFVKISLTEKATCIITLTNMIGQKVFESEYNELNVINLNIKDFENGLYFISIKYNSKEYVRKLVKV